MILTFVAQEDVSGKPKDKTTLLFLVEDSGGFHSDHWLVEDGFHSQTFADVPGSVSKYLLNNIFLACVHLLLPY